MVHRTGMAVIVNKPASAAQVISKTKDGSHGPEALLALHRFVGTRQARSCYEGVDAASS